MNFFRSFFTSTARNNPTIMAESTKKVQDLINENSVVVFSKSYCPYCTATKKLLTGLGANYETLELDNTADGDKLQAALHEISGQRTVPNIYIKQKHIGGNSDLQKLSSNDQLEDLLRESGALKA